jgi:hypothetical protein
MDEAQMERYRLMGLEDNRETTEEEEEAAALKAGALRRLKARRLLEATRGQSKTS